MGGAVIATIIGTILFCLLGSASFCVMYVQQTVKELEKEIELLKKEKLPCYDDNLTNNNFR